MTIALIYHKDPFGKTPRGGESSVRIIVEYLREKGHVVKLYPEAFPFHIKKADVVLTWGKPVLSVARVCKVIGVPLVVMVRFWRNVAPRPVGKLMTRMVDLSFTRERQVIFDTAAAIITNNEYSKGVIERWQPVSKYKVYVSYVPILGEYEPNTEGDRIGIITPEIYGEQWLIEHLSEQMPEEKFLVINGEEVKHLSHLQNVDVKGYMHGSEFWHAMKCILVPVYCNDICGTKRVTIEAMRQGIPVIASDACGMSEKVPGAMLVDGDASIDQWVQKIKHINGKYKAYQKMAKQAWEQYNTPAQLQKFEQILLESCES